MLLLFMQGIICNIYIYIIYILYIYIYIIINMLMFYLEHK